MPTLGERLLDQELRPETVRAFETSTRLDRLRAALPIIIERGEWPDWGRDFRTFLRKKVWEVMVTLMEEAGDDEVIFIHEAQFAARMKELLAQEGRIFGGHPKSLRVPHKSDLEMALRNLAEDIAIWLSSNNLSVEDENYSLEFLGRDVVGHHTLH